MERLGKVGQPMRLTANNYFSPPLGTIITDQSLGVCAARPPDTTQRDGYRAALEPLVASATRRGRREWTTHRLFYSFNFGVEWVSYQT
jgi:hypothetical protein